MFLPPPSAIGCNRVPNRKSSGGWLNRLAMNLSHPRATGCDSLLASIALARPRLHISTLAAPVYSRSDVSGRACRCIVTQRNDWPPCVASWHRRRRRFVRRLRRLVCFSLRQFLWRLSPWLSRSRCGAAKGPGAPSDLAFGIAGRRLSRHLIGHCELFSAKVLVRHGRESERGR